MWHFILLDANFDIKMVQYNTFSILVKKVMQKWSEIVLKCQMAGIYHKKRQIQLTMYSYTFSSQ